LKLHLALWAHFPAQQALRARAGRRAGRSQCLGDVSSRATQPLLHRHVGLVIFAFGAALLAWLSGYALRKPRSHGFYRFFAWMCILALGLVNAPTWERDPLAPH